VDGGSWRSATFDAVPGDLASLERFNWTVALASDAFGEGEHEVEVRAVTENGLSLSSFATFTGTVSAGDDGSVSRLAVLILVLAMLLTGAAALRGASERPFSLRAESTQTDLPASKDVDLARPEDVDAGAPPS